MNNSKQNKKQDGKFHSKKIKHDTQAQEELDAGSPNVTGGGENG